MRVVVVGAGIVGAAVAYESVRAGADVVLLDKSLPASGVLPGTPSPGSVAPRRGDVPDASTPLRRRVLEGYRRLERAVPGVQVRWLGSLMYEELDERAPLFSHKRVLKSDEIARLEPHLAHPPARAVYLGRRVTASVDRQPDRPLHAPRRGTSSVPP